MVEEMKTMEGFQQTEIGVFPTDWLIIPLDSISHVTSGKRLPMGYSLINTETQHPYIRVADMYMGGIDDSEMKYVPDSIFPSISRYRIFIDDIFISVAGTLGIIGKIPKILDGANLTENADRITKIKCDRDYLMYVLMSFLIQNKIESEKTLGAQPKLALTRIRNFQIPIPSTKTEQTSIATALCDMDDLIDGVGKLLIKKRNIKQGAMQELLKPKDSWKGKELGKVATLKARIGWQGLTTAEYKKTGEYFLITGTEFKNGFIDWDKCHYVEHERYRQDKNIQVKPHDVLVTKDGTIGKVALIKSVPKPATLNSGVFVIRPTDNSFHPKFFYYLLLSNVFLTFLSQLSAGSTINHLYQKDFVKFKFLTPETIGEQEEIANILFEMDEEIEKLETQRSKYKMHKIGMMQMLLTGKKRFV
jgi:type I restriction enzyme S subunit